jgi:hypothetical protein
VTWTAAEAETLIDSFDLSSCILQFGLNTMPETRTDYFPREIIGEIKRNQDRPEQINYLDIAILSIKNLPFQNVFLSMKFDNTFYSLFSGQSKKVMLF